MRTIFPLDFSYSFVFALFNILSTVIRFNRDEYNMLVYIRNFQGIILVTILYKLNLLFPNLFLIEWDGRTKFNYKVAIRIPLI